MDKALKTYESLKAAFNKKTPDLKACGDHLASLKVFLAQISFLTPTAKSKNQELLLVRDILEIGAQYSIAIKDVEGFERYIVQLKTYYMDYGKLLPHSERMYPLLGLDLLRLLSQNRISEFHTAVERIEASQLSNIYIKHPIQLEQWLMEGSYNKVWNSRVDMPAPEYQFFIDVLMLTIRNEIASCSEKAYVGLPITDAATLLYFKKTDEFLAFAKKRNWKIDVGSKRVSFSCGESNRLEEIPSHSVLEKTLYYAKELERIV